MRKALAKKLFSIFFLSIFLSKMVISIAPLIIAHLDSECVNNVIMQLEIEHPKSVDVKDAAIKEFLNLHTITIAALHPLVILMPVIMISDHDKHIRSFYPVVPTPPPNV